MATPGSNDEEEKAAEAQRKAMARAEKLKWSNDPETVHSMADVDEEFSNQTKNAISPFLLTEGESVIASKTTAKAEAAARTSVSEEIKNSSEGSLSGSAINTDQLLSQWSGQKQAQRAKSTAQQDALLKRIRSEIDHEIEQIKQSGHPLSATIVLIARAFGKDPKQWLPADKISNLFIEAVLYSVGMDLPWGFDATPDYAELKYILGEDKRFTRVFRKDKLRPNESAADFAGSFLQDGDIILWVTPEIRLSGFLERSQAGQYNILAAGSPDSPTGFIYTTLEFFIQSYAAGNPTPDAVYRLSRIV